MPTRDSATLSVELQNGRRFQIHPEYQPIPPGLLHENSTAYFRLDGSGFDPFSVNLRVDGVELESSPKSSSSVRWKWEIGFHAGIAQVELEGLLPRTLKMEVLSDPQVAKLTRGEYQSMVGDILTDTLALIGLAGHRAGIARGESLLEIARFEYLRKVLSLIERSIQEVNKSPWAKLHRMDRTVPLGRSTGLSSRQLIRAVGLPGNVRKVDARHLSDAGKRLASSLKGHLPLVVPQTHGRLDTRLREHADILSALLLWKSFLNGVRVAVEKTEKADRRDPRLEAVKLTSSRMYRSLTALIDLPVFDGVSATRGMIKPSHLYTRVPAYRSFYKAYRGFLAGLSDIHGDFLNLPLKQTFDLYELWCFLRLAHAAALDSGKAEDWKQAFTERASGGGLTISLEGKPLKFGAFSLVFQPLYREVWKTDGPRIGSYSRLMQPDIALTTSGYESRSEKPIVVLDAKYRVEAEMNDAIAAMHTYRDALVELAEESGKLARRPPIRAAFILTPYLPHEESENWRRDRTPEVFFREGYQTAFKFGAITMRPGITIPEVTDILRVVLEHASYPSSNL